MAKFFPKQSITLEIQNHNVKSRFPEFRYRWKQGTGIWTGDIKPTPISTLYKVRIIYKMKELPKVEVVTPELLIREDAAAIPHTYANKKPCIFDPMPDWNSNKLIATTIIPWFSLWLYYYEVWFQTGEWLGGGRHPEIKTENKKDKIND